MTKNIIISLFFLSFSTFLNASDDAKLNYGVELDALPYLSGGYYLSGWVGKNKFRFRGIVASVNIPSFAVEPGFQDNKLKAYALVVDYFPSQDFAGVWYGGGVEVWDSEIQSKNESAVAKYRNYVLTVGAGYTWYFHKNIYLNPWGAVHGIIGGDDTVNVGSSVFEPKKITGEVSLKVGFKF